MLRHGKQRKTAGPATPAPRQVSNQQTSVRPSVIDFRWLSVAVGIVLAVLVLYSPLYSSQAEFFRLDDGAYVVTNEQVHAGLSPSSIAWAFTTFDAANWHPLTWLSLQFDYDLYRLNAGGYHFTNALLHALNAMLLLVVLTRLTGAFWPSACVASFFALHPLHVESVAWIAERKDVLSTFFWIIALGTYGWYVEKPAAGRYLLVTLAFALGLLAKPMVVTLPCVFLLLDYWPLQRLGQGGTKSASLRWLLIEKLPWFAMSAAACVVTVVAQRVNETPLYAEYSMLARFMNAALAYVQYIGMTFWPVHLAPIYAQPFDQVPMVWGLAATLVLLGITAICLFWVRRWPYLAIGWFWYLGTLVPVIGIVQVGIQSMADRYTYVPHIGLFIMVVWGCRDLLAARVAPVFQTIAIAVLLSACFVTSFLQVQLWESNIAIWEHAVAVTKNNFAAHDNLGVAYMVKGRSKEAIDQFRKAIALEPRYSFSHQHLGQALLEQKDIPAALTSLSEAVRLAPHLTDVQQDLALLYMQQGKMEEALPYARAVADVTPTDPAAHTNYGIALFMRGQVDEAEKQFQAALKLKPTTKDEVQNAFETTKWLGQLRSVQGRLLEAELCFRSTLMSDASGRRVDAASSFYLAWTLAAQGKAQLARDLIQQATKQFPRWPVIERDIAWHLATSPQAHRRNGSLALLRAQVVQQALDQDPQAWETLAAALAEVGRYPDAVNAQRQAIQLVKSIDGKELMQQRLRLYEEGKPLRVELK